MKISIVTSLYRSSAYIEEFYRRCSDAVARIGGVDCEFVFVNDASPENDLSIALKLARAYQNVIVVDLSRNFGQHRALLTGIAWAKGDFVFVLDSDLEEKPEWIEIFYEEMIKCGADVVYGVQITRKRGLLYRAGRSIYYSVLNHLSEIELPRNAATARLMSRRYTDELLKFTEREVFLSGIWHATGFIQVPVNVQKVATSPTNYSASKLVGMVVNAIVSFSTRPLVMIGLLGICVSVFAFIFTAATVARKLMWDIAVDGWASMMAVSLLLGGLILLSNGIIAIYIAKIFIEVKQRPRSIVRSVVDSQNRSTRLIATDAIDRPLTGEG